jgi:hypothetical protein
MCKLLIPFFPKSIRDSGRHPHSRGTLLSWSFSTEFRRPSYQSWESITTVNLGISKSKCAVMSRGASPKTLIRKGKVRKK